MLLILGYSIMKKTQNSLIFVLICSCFFSFSQENDFQTWNSVKLRKKVYKRTVLSLKQGLRLRENSTLISQNFTDVKLQHRIKKTDVEISLGYRLKDDYSLSFNREFAHRYYFDVSYKYKYRRILISLRDRFQIQGNQKSFNSLFRNKIGLSYNIRKTSLDPFLSFEYFLDLNEDKINKLRYTAGFSYDLYKNLVIDLFYRVQNTINVDNRKNIYILGTSLSYKL